MPVADLSVGPPAAPEVEVVSGLDDGTLAGDDFAELEAAPHVDESMVRTLLKSMGGGLGYALGDDDVPDHWRFSDRELDDLTPPLTRIINRRPKWRQAVARGDEMAVAIVLAGYTGRNLTAGRQAQEARNERDREAASPAWGGPADAPRAAEGHGDSGGHGRGVH